MSGRPHLSLAPRVDVPLKHTLDDVASVLAEVERSIIPIPPGRLRVFTRHIEVPEDTCWTPHRHVECELLWGIDPVITVITEVGVFTVPSAMSLWLPAGIVHEVRAPAGSALRCTWLRLPNRSGVGLGDQPVAVPMPPLLASVLDHLDDWTLTGPQRARAEAFALDLLTPPRTSSLAIALPQTPSVAAVAQAVVDDPASAPSLEEASRRAGLSVRGFSRVFSREVGLSFGQWVTRVRVQHASAALAGGTPVAVVGRRVGYRNSSAFTAAFARVTGTTPGTFMASTQRRSESA